MAAVVFHVEVPVGGLCQHELGEPSLHLGLLVAELVGVGDADATDPTDADGDGQLGDPRPGTVDEEPGADQERDVLQWQVQVGEPAVVVVRLERGHDLFGRIRSVGSEDRVQRGDQQVDERGGQPPPEVRSAHSSEPRRGEGQCRHQQTDRPQVAPRVDIRRGARGPAPALFLFGQILSGVVRFGRAQFGRAHLAAPLDRLGWGADGSAWLASADAAPLSAPSTRIRAITDATTSGGSSGALIA